jgi:pyruvate-ferredoxin/flavodoxin oxidoreductase
VQKNWAAVDASIENMHEVTVPAAVTSSFDLRLPVPKEAPEFVRQLTAMILAGEGDKLPVSMMPADGVYPTGTTKWEKRNIAQEVPVWDESICIQCGKCVMVCPHGVIRSKIYETSALAGAPETFKHTAPKWKELKDQAFTLQVSTEDCTGCSLCVEVCPVKNKSEVRLKAINMTPQAPLRDAEVENWEFFEALPDLDRNLLNPALVKNVQLLEPLFEFSGACAGCGETPYVKLLSQLYGDHLIMANATGCSSIYGGNLPTTPWTVNKDGRGPAWANSLFEDNAEFGLGMRVSLDKQIEYATYLLRTMSADLGSELAEAILTAVQDDDLGLAAQRERVVRLRERLAGMDSPAARDLAGLADAFVKKSVWIMGGDGWAYDIGFGGLDHVLSTGRNVNILVLDTEVYSNTGGQCSKATPRGAVAKFAAAGKPAGKKDLALMAMSYGNAYVAKVAMGADDTHTLRAFREAEAYPGPSLIIAYSHCIAHGYNLQHGMDQQDAAVKSGHWPLFRFNPTLKEAGENPFKLDSKPPKLPLRDYIYNETRYKMLALSDPDRARRLLDEAQAEIHEHWRNLEFLAAQAGAPITTVPVAPPAAAPTAGTEH